MKLNELFSYEEIVIQCHDNPDADAIASGYALYEYLAFFGKNVRLIYSGNYKVGKRNLQLMIEELDIPIEKVDVLNPPEMLVTVDCQYGEGNVTHFDAKNVAIIDHHQISVKMPQMFEIKSNLGSCSTLMWKLLKEEGFPLEGDTKLATALYYGLYTDTNGFTEMDHPYDRDLRDTAKADKNLIAKFKNSNLTLNDLTIAGEALKDHQYNDEYLFAILEVKPCDPNMLGLISDLVIEVDKVETCLVYSILSTGIKISVRSCNKEVKASELACSICDAIGSGGGHAVKAGGFIQINLLRDAYETYCKKNRIQHRKTEKGKKNPSKREINEFLGYRIIDYFLQSEVIYASNYKADFSKMKLYKKNPVSLGYVRLYKVYGIGTEVNIRTMRRDLNIKVKSDQIIMICDSGEIKEISEKEFKSSYKAIEEDFQPRDVEYNPTIRANGSEKMKCLMHYAKKCIFIGEEMVYARAVSKNIKLFSIDDEAEYKCGVKGDYLVIQKDNVKNISICMKDKFSEYYREI